MLSKVQSTDCYFPFLDEYNSFLGNDDLLNSSIIKYVKYKKMVAVSFQLFTCRDKKSAKKY